LRRIEVGKALKLAEEIYKKVPKNKGVVDYKITYSYYTDPRPQLLVPDVTQIGKQFGGNTATHACFAGLNSRLKGKKLNRVCVEFKHCSKTLPHLSENEKRKWVVLLKEHGLLPEYFKQTWIKKNKYVIELNSGNIPMSLLYMYLSGPRYVRDDPSFVRSVLIMMKHGVNFHLAFVFASALHIHNSGHHIIAVSGFPGLSFCKDPKAVLDTSFDVRHAIGLKRYIEDPTKWDDRSVFGGMRWECHEKLMSTTKISADVKGADIFNVSLIKAVESADDAEAQQHIDEFNNSKEEN
jgi:hypothetical protein